MIKKNAMARGTHLRVFRTKKGPHAFVVQLGEWHSSWSKRSRPGAIPPLSYKTPRLTWKTSSPLRGHTSFAVTPCWPQRFPTRADAVAYIGYIAALQELRDDMDGFDKYGTTKGQAALPTAHEFMRARR